MKNVNIANINPSKLFKSLNSRKFIPENFAKYSIRENKSIKFRENLSR